MSIPMSSSSINFSSSKDITEFSLHFAKHLGEGVADSVYSGIRVANVPLRVLKGTADEGSGTISLDTLPVVVSSKTDTIIFSIDLFA